MHTRCEYQLPQSAAKQSTTRMWSCAQEPLQDQERMESQGSKSQPNVHMVQQIQWERCIHDERGEFSHNPIYNGEICESSNWYSPLPWNKLPIVQESPTLTAAATQSESQPSGIIKANPYYILYKLLKK